MRARWGRSPEVELDNATLATLVQPAYPGRTVIEACPARGGLGNTNLRLRLSGAEQPVLLRLYRRDARAAAKEHALHRLLTGRVVLPGILLGPSRSPLVEGPYVLMEWVEGERLELLAPRLARAELVRLGADVGRVLASIHAVTFPEQGFLDGALQVHPFPAAFGDSLPDLLRVLLGERGTQRLGSDLMQRLLDFAERESGRLEPWGGPPCLVHGDFGGSNILVRLGERGPRVAAVLDWEFAFSGSPFIDFSNLLRPPLGELPGFEQAVADGYRAAGGALPDDWRWRSRLIDLTNWAEFLGRPEANAALIEDARGAIARAVAGSSL